VWAVVGAAKPLWRRPAAENRPEVEGKGRSFGSGLEVEGKGRSLTSLGKR
jgi:hypothetical protein